MPPPILRPTDLARWLDRSAARPAAQPAWLPRRGSPKLYSASISGTPAVGQVLTAVLTGTGGSGFTYQWQRNGVDIVGETASTYTVVLADEGTTLRVVASYTVIATGLPQSTTSGGVLIPLPFSRFLLEVSDFLLLESGDYLLLEA